MRFARILMVWFAVGFPATLLAADGDLLRVYPPGEKPDDPRSILHGIDNPADFTGRFADKAAWEERAAFLRRQVLVANGLWPMPEKMPIDAVVHGKIDRDDYTIEKVYFTSLPGHYVTGNLYRPKTAGKHPVVLCPHGHWPNGRFMWTDDKAAQKEIAAGAEKTEAGAHSVLQARCAMLARMGCVVFHYDMVGYADSTKLVHRKGMTDVESVLRLQSQMGLQTWNGIRSIDFVSTLQDVDTTRIAVTGASGGGTQTFILGAVDPRVAVAFPAVMVGMAMQGGCVCENAPLLRVNSNNAELAALFAPRPLGMSCANDWTKELETRGLPEIRAIYKLYRAEDVVTARHFPFPHNYNQVSREMMYGFMNQHLKLGYATPGAEKPFVPVPPAELSVWDEKHPIPADAADTDALRKTMTALSDKQIIAMAADNDAYKKMLRGAVEAMIVDRYPGKLGVRVSRHSGPIRKEGITIERGEVERAADGTKVPYVAGIPDGWNGQVIIWVNAGGKQQALDADGNPSPELHAIVASKAAVVLPDLYWTGEQLPGGKPAAVPANPPYAAGSNPPYAAFTLGYNRSLLGNRVHDLLSVVAMVRGWEGTQSVRVIGMDKAGPIVLLAKAASGNAIDKLAADLGGFDFDQVTKADDELLLPGALKYGGVVAFLRICEEGQTTVAGLRKGSGVKASDTLHASEATQSFRELGEWLLQ